MLVSPRVGIGILEIKDWNLQTPSFHRRKSEHGTDELIGTHDGRDFKQENPVRKLRYYKREPLDIYCPRLVAPAGMAAISAGVIFPFASEADAHKLFGGQLRSKYEFVAGSEALMSNYVARIFPAARHHSSRLMAPDLAGSQKLAGRARSFDGAARAALLLDTNQRGLVGTHTQSGYRRIR